jgi:hypothetical protein
VSPRERQRTRVAVAWTHPVGVGRPRVVEQPPLPNDPLGPAKDSQLADQQAMAPVGNTMSQPARPPPALEAPALEALSAAAPREASLGLEAAPLTAAVAAPPVSESPVNPAPALEAPWLQRSGMADQPSTEVTGIQPEYPLTVAPALSQEMVPGLTCPGMGSGVAGRSQSQPAQSQQRDQRCCQGGVSVLGGGESFEQCS